MKNKILPIMGMIFMLLLTASVSFSQITVTSTVTDVSCIGNCDGIIALSPTGGVGNYTYLWDNAQVTQSATALCIGTYTVTVTEDLSVPFDWPNQNNGTNHTILIPASSVTIDGITGFQLGDRIGVFYDSDGLGTMVCGGYSEWLPLNATQGSTGVAAYGDGTLTVDKDGFIEGEAFTWKFYRISDGQVIDLSVTYNPLLPNQGNFTTNGISGVLTLTGTSSTPMTTTHSATVGEPLPISTTALVTNVSTFNGTDGAIDLTVVNGVSPFTFSWTGGSTDQNLTGLSADTYEVVVTDANSCTGTGSYQVIEPSAVIVTPTITNVTCFGGSNGEISLAISGGTSPYTTSWAGGASTTTITGLTAGGYNVTVTDDNGAVATGSYTITEADEISLPGAITNVDCNGNSNGAIVLTVINGVSPFDFAWSNSETTQNISGLGLGTVYLLVTDDSGCTASNSYTVVEPALLSFTGSISNFSGFSVSAFGASDGTIDLTVSGGTGPYTFSWLPAATDQNLSGLAAGTYEVTVTDLNSCTESGTFTLTEPPSSGLSVSGTATTLDCNSDCNGEITVVASGGQPPYTYAWSNFMTDATITGLCSGSYSVTVTDDAGVVVGSVFDWTIPNTGSDHTIIMLATTDILIDGVAPSIGDYFGVFFLDGSGTETCGGYTMWSGTTTAIAAKGDDTETAAKDGFGSGEAFIWKYYRMSDQVTVDLAATYMVPGSFPGVSATGTYVHNGASGLLTLSGTTPPPSSANQGFASFNIVEPTAIVATGVESNVSCNLGTNGAIDLTVSGGTPGYSFLWSNGETTQNVSGLSAGNYDVVVTDANSCTSQVFFTITEPTAIALSGVETMVSCFEGNNGAVALTVSGGTPSYTYLWTGGQTTEDISSIMQGTHAVVVTDANSCTASISFTITEPSELLVSGIVTNLLCNGTQSGEIAVTVSGGVAGYTYLWSDNSTDEDLTGLSGDTYGLTVTDANSCTSEVIFNVLEPDAIAITGSSTDVTCNSGSNGSVGIEVVGGTGLYSYLWTDGYTDEDISALTANTYVVVVTDANSCTATESYIVSEPSAIEATVIYSNISCFGYNDGSLMLNVTGGVPTYNYLWNGGATSSSLTGLVAGTYSVTITDASGCTMDYTYTLTQPTLLEVSGIVTDLTCFGTLAGAINVSPSGGTPGYTYAWDNLADTEDLANLAGGTYIITVYDASSCFASETFTVFEPTELTVIGSATDVSCFGGNDGAVSIDVNGGTPGYSFAWTGGSTDEDISMLIAGDYTVVVTDANNCTATELFTVSEPDILAATAVSEDISCYGLSDGSITLTVAGGTMDYSFAWTNGETTQNITGLAADNYGVTITDANGCTVDYSYVVIEPTLLEVTGIATDLGCYGTQTGAIDITVTGGTQGYTYLWNDNSLDNDRTGLSGGTFVVVVTDNHGCTASETFIVVEPSLFIASGVATDVSCFGGNDGAIALTVEGGVPGYTYSWDNNATIDDLENLVAGSYAVTVYDTNNCPAPASFTISQPDLLSASATLDHISCNGITDGEVALDVTGGTLPYSFLWDDNSTLEDVTGLGSGAHSVTITDGHGCIFTDSYTINEPALLEVSGTVINLLCAGTQLGEIDITVTGGTMQYNYLWTGGSTIEDQTGLSGGTYSVTVTDANGCVAVDSYTVVEPDALSMTSSVVDALCFGDNNGQVTVMLSGGTPTYQYSWSNGGSNDVNSGLVADDYTIIVTDANGCSITDTYTVSQPDQLSLTAVTANVDCYGGNSGSAVATVSGGTTPYVYSWDNGYTDADNTGLVADNYGLTVTDANGCLISDSYAITEPAAPIQLSTTVTDVTVLWGSDGSIDLTVTGGVSPYSYSWSNSLLIEDIFGLSEGTYTVVVTDANGCTESTSAYVNQPPSSPDWTYFNTGINHTILIPGTANLNVYGNPLMPGDYIGLFYDSLGFDACGGLLQYNGSVAAIAAWGAQSGNVDGFAIGEEFKWKVWIAQTNTEYTMDATYIPAGTPQIFHEQYFASNGQSGITELVVSGGIQGIALTPMWNIISSYLIPVDLAMSSVFANNVSNISLVKNENGAMYWPAWNLDMIGNWIPQEGYNVYAIAADTLIIEGEFINPLAMPVNLPSGWSLFGYPRVSPGNAVIMLAPIVSNINLIKNQDGFVYWPVFQLNAIGNLVPGQGYYGFMSATSTLYFPANSTNVAKSNLVRVNNKHYGQIGNTGVNMTIGLPLSSWDVTPNYLDEIAVYNNSGNLVGKGVFTNDDMAIAIWGDDSETEFIDGMLDNESFTLAIWSEFSNKESVLEVSWIEGDSNYETNGISIAGKVTSIENIEFSLGQNIPNPVKTTTEIRFTLVDDCNVELALYNILGDKLEVISNGFMSSGAHTITFDASNYATGTYIYRIEAGSFISSKQLNIIK